MWSWVCAAIRPKSSPRWNRCARSCATRAFRSAEKKKPAIFGRAFFTSVSSSCGRRLTSLLWRHRGASRWIGPPACPVRRSGRLFYFGESLDGLGRSADVRFGDLGRLLGNPVQVVIGGIRGGEHRLHGSNGDVRAGGCVLRYFVEQRDEVLVPLRHPALRDFGELGVRLGGN